MRSVTMGMRWTALQGAGVLCRGHRGPMNCLGEGPRQDRVRAPGAPLGEVREAGAGPVSRGTEKPPGLQEVRGAGRRPAQTATLFRSPGATAF